MTNPQVTAAPRRFVRRSTERRREHLHHLLLNAENCITDAERRIEDHQNLWHWIAEDNQERHAHIQLESNLVESLKLLHTLRAIVLHEIRDEKIPRRVKPKQHVVSGDALRLASLEQTIAWLDRLPTGNINRVIAGQQERAARELWQRQKKLLWREYDWS